MLAAAAKTRIIVDHQVDICSSGVMQLLWRAAVEEIAAVHHLHTSINKNSSVADMMMSTDGTKVLAGNAMGLTIPGTGALCSSIPAAAAEGLGRLAGVAVGVLSMEGDSIAVVAEQSAAAASAILDVVPDCTCLF
jgi:hypothetical protein